MGEPGLNNRVDGEVAGALVQAASVYGGVHLYTPQSVVAVPRQLPGAVRHFVGRNVELAELSWHLEQVQDSPGAVAISTLEGMGGIGKSALALHWAQNNIKQFPDGQLYVNLRGFSPGEATQPGEALWSFLHALGVPTDAPPTELEEQAALFRSLIAGRRMLILLDNARDSEQVRPLLPGTSSCQVLVTSRHRLTGLVAQMGARPITLDSLTETESAALLGRLLGQRRIAAEPGAVSALVEHCARLPLALTILGGRLAGQPGLPLGRLAERLGDARDRLETLDTGEAGVNVKTVFSWSYEALDAPVAAAFRLLSLHPDPDFSLAAAASTAGVDVTEADRLLSELTRAHLLEDRLPGRYGFHDLVRLYARNRALAEDSDSARQQAIHRMLDHYLHTGVAADAHLGSPWEPLAVDRPQPGTQPETIRDAEQAMAWFSAEHVVVLGVLEQHGGGPFDGHIWRLAHTLVTYLDRQGHWRDFVTTQRAALAAAQRQEDQPAQALAHRLLARALIRQDKFDEACGHLHAALTLFTAMHDLAGQAHTRYAMGYLDVRAGNCLSALKNTSHAVSLAETSGQQIWRAKALNNVGWCHLEFGNYHDALPYSQQALHLFRTLGTDPDGEAHTLECLGSTHLGLNQPQQALHHFQQALLIREQLGNHYTQARTLRLIAAAHRATGEHAAAQVALHHALPILDRLGHAEALTVRAELTQPHQQTKDTHTT